MNLAFSFGFAQNIETRICATSSYYLDLLYVNCAINYTNLQLRSVTSDPKLVFATFSLSKCADEQRVPTSMKDLNRADARAS